MTEVGAATGRPAPTRILAHHRFGALWLAAVLLPALGCGLAAWSAWRDVQSEAATRLARMVDVLHEHALRAVQTQEVILAAIDGHVAGLDWSQIAASAEIHAFLQRLEVTAPAIYGTALVDPAGMLASVGRGPHPTPTIDLNDRDYVAAHRARQPGLYVSAPLVTRPSGQFVFALSRGRTGPDGQLDGGSIVSTFDPTYFARFHQSMSETPDDVQALLRLDGLQLARTPAAPAYSELEPLPAEHPLMRAIAAAPTGRGTAWLPVSRDGAARQVSFRRVAEYPLAVVYGMAESGLRAAWWARLPPILGLSTAAMLLLAGLTALASRSVRREAAALSAAAMEAAHARAEVEARSEAEARLRQAERMGALGQVAAGVAHDFNNLVQATLGAARLLHRRAEDPAAVRRLADMVQDAGERGGRVAHRMLDFARRRGGGQDRFDIHATLTRMRELLAGNLGPGVRVRLIAPADLPPSQGDRAEFETVVLNLAANARDAMPAGGTLEIHVAQVDIPAGQGAEALGLSPGRFLTVSLTDTGEGMAPDVLARVGEPFFTTKPAGKGTGLGLSLARRFTEQCSGTLRLTSQPGVGTTVTLWLRAAVADAPALARAS